MANQQQLEGSWNRLKGKLKERWGQLTDDELDEVEGDAEQLVGLIQQKTGQTRQQVERTLDEISEESGSYATQASEAARQYVDQASEALQDTADQVASRVRASYSSAEEMVQRKPAESVAIAFGTGLIAGVIVGLVARR